MTVATLWTGETHAVPVRSKCCRIGLCATNNALERASMEGVMRENNLFSPAC